MRYWHTMAGLKNSDKSLHFYCDQLELVDINRLLRYGRMTVIRSPDGISVERLQRKEALEPSEPWVSMKNTGS